MIISEDSEAASREASERVRSGSVFAFLTDTLYGLGADPWNTTAIQEITNLKGRAPDKPILVVVSNPSKARLFFEGEHPLMDIFSKGFWPGPLTIVGKAKTDLPAELTAGTGSVGVRAPAEPRVRRLIEACGGALTATSANPANLKPALTALEVENYFGKELLVLDGGEARSPLPSTVIDIQGQEFRMIREGTISLNQIHDLLDHA